MRKDKWVRSNDSNKAKISYLSDALCFNLVLLLYFNIHKYVNKI